VSTPLNRNAIDVEFQSGHTLEFAVSTDIEDVSSPTDCDGVLIVKEDGTYAPIDIPADLTVSTYDASGEVVELQGSDETCYVSRKYTYIAVTDGELPKSGMKLT